MGHDLDGLHLWDTRDYEVRHMADRIRQGDIPDGVVRGPWELRAHDLLEKKWVWILTIVVSFLVGVLSGRFYFVN